MGTISKSKKSREVEELQEASKETEKILNIGEAVQEREEEEKNQDLKKLHLVNFKLPYGDFLKYKNLFGGNGYSFSQGNRMILDWFYKEVEEGKLELSTCGIRETLQKKMRG